MPIGNRSPELCDDVSDTTPPELSVVVGGVHDTAAVAELGSVFLLIFNGVSIMAGICASVVKIN